jgi:hypothetical protein
MVLLQEITIRVVCQPEFASVLRQRGPMDRVPDIDVPVRDLCGGDDVPDAEVKKDLPWFTRTFAIKCS